MAQSSATTTKSIDVGSIFLMDMPVNDSEYNNDNESSDSGPWINNGNHSMKFSMHPPTLRTSEKSDFELNEDFYRNSTSAFLNQLQVEQREQRKNEISISDNNQQQQQQYQEKQNCDWQLSTNEGCSDNSKKHVGQRYSTSGLLFSEVTPPQQQQQHSTNDDMNLNNTASMLSVSDEDDSYANSSETSPCASFVVASAGNSIPTENEDKGSTTTREDSGVLDMKDLDGPLVSGYFHDENDEDEKNQVVQKQRLRQQGREKATISTNSSAATNLINIKEETRKLANELVDDDSSIESDMSNHGRIQIQHHHTYQYHNHQRGGHSSSSSLSSNARRNVSASLPIKVPARQMKKGLHKMKLKLADENLDLANLDSRGNQDDSSVEPQPITSIRRRRSTENSSGSQTDPVDEVDEFLQQEYNENHHNHYPIDELDEDRPTSPMKLFESIQALARSMHEDSQIFGSLPPKRMLESPIRSLAIV